jgi:hypothetical protein
MLKSAAPLNVRVPKKLFAMSANSFFHVKTVSIRYSGYPLKCRLIPDFQSMVVCHSFYPQKNTAYTQTVDKK